MLGSTLNAYKKTYNKRLSDHVKDYADNDEDSFLEKELINFEDYYNDLKITLDYLKNLSKKDVKDEARVLSVLKSLNIFKPKYTLEFKEYLIRNNENNFKLPNKFPHENKVIKTINNRITSTKRILDFINEEQKNSKNKKNDKQYKDTIWFKVGVLFASGKMSKYYKIKDNEELYFNPAYTSPRVAEDLGDKSYDKYILATINNYTGDKNIFNSQDKMLKIISHCNEEGIPVIPYFTKRLPPE